MKAKIQQSGAHPQMLECEAHGVSGHRKHPLILDAAGANYFQRLNRAP
jgi:hypothetical protein